MLLYISMLILTTILFNGGNSDLTHQYLLLQPREDNINSIFIHSIELSNNGAFVVGEGFEQIDENLYYSSTYLWDLSLVSEESIIYPIETQISQWDKPFFANASISPDSLYVLVHSESQIWLVNSSTFVVEKILPISSAKASCISVWSQDSSRIGFLLNNFDEGTRLFIWDLTTDTNYEKWFDFYPTHLQSVNNMWLIWGMRGYFILCSQFLEYCQEYRAETGMLNFILPTLDSTKIISGVATENSVYQMITWQLTDNIYEPIEGTIVDLGSIPNIISSDGAYLSTSYDIFETSSWNHISKFTEFGNNNEIFTLDNKSLITFDSRNLMIYDVLSGNLIDKIDLINQLNLDFSEFGYYGYEYIGIDQISKDNKWIVIRLGSVVSLVPIANSIAFP